MKKVVVAAAVLLAVAGVKAQNVSLGPVASFTHSWVTGTDGMEREFNPGFKAGLTLTYSINPHWAIGGDLLYSLEGVKVKKTVLATTYTTTAHNDYIRVPLKVSYFFGELGDRMRPKLYLGPSLGFLVASNTRVKTENGSTSAETKTETKANYNKFDLGGMVGAGFNYRVGTATWLNFDLNYTNGFSDITKDDNTFSSNRNIGVSLGVAFPLGTIKSAK
ncbi:MAG: porin family protein [Chitinophagaceae bacterium]